MQTKKKKFDLVLTNFQLSNFYKFFPYDSRKPVTAGSLIERQDNMFDFRFLVAINVLVDFLPLFAFFLFVCMCCLQVYLQGLI